MSEKSFSAPHTEEGRARQTAELMRARHERNKYIAALGTAGIEKLMIPTGVDPERIEDFAATQAAKHHDLVDLEPPRGEK